MVQVEQLRGINKKPSKTHGNTQTLLETLKKKKENIQFHTTLSTWDTKGPFLANSVFTGVILENRKNASTVSFVIDYKYCSSPATVLI